MAYINYARVNVQRNYGKSSAVTTITAELSSLPWAKAYETYVEAADEWEELALAAHKAHQDEAYEHVLRKKEEALQEANPEAGAWEGNVSDEFPQQPYTPLPAKAVGRRKAGQKALVEHFIKGNNFGDWSKTIMPQIITKIGNMKITKNENGLISGTQFVKDNFNSAGERGLYVFLMLDTRSSYLGTQYKGTSRPYSSLVPLILYAIRLVKGVPYTAWDPEEIRMVVNNDLADAMLFRTEDWPTKDDLLEGREKGLTFASGKDIGKVRSPVSTYRLYATAGTCYMGMPSMVQVMLAQIWVAHPDNRTKYMVLDPVHWEKVPPALVQVEALPPEPVYTIEESAPALSWI